MQTGNIYLEVPYSQKDIAKNLGAKWDPVKKQWYVSGNLDIKPFKKWLPFIETEENLRAEYFYLAQANKHCYKCNNSTVVNAIILPEGFEAVDDYTMDELEAQGIHVEKTLFCQQDYQSILSYVTYISPEALDIIYEYTGCSFKKEYSSSVNYSYYRSICNICLAAQGDNYTISEFNTAFHPINIDDFKKIKFYKIPQKIRVHAGINSVGYSSDNSVVVRNIWNK